MKSTEGDGCPAVDMSCQRKDSLHLFIPNNRSPIVPAASDPISLSKYFNITAQGAGPRLHPPGDWKRGGGRWHTFRREPYPGNTEITWKVSVPFEQKINCKYCSYLCQLMLVSMFTYNKLYRPERWDCELR